MSGTQIEPPIAVIGFSNLGSPIEEAWPSTHRALLPIAGQPVIVRLMQQLSAQGISHLRIAGSIQQVAVKQRIGDGSEWGLKVRYSDLHGADLRSQTLLERGRCLYLAGDVLHAGRFESSGALGRMETTKRLSAVEEESSLWALDVNGEQRLRLSPVRNEATASLRLADAGSFHRANLAAVKGLINNINIPGRQMRSGVWEDWSTDVADDAHIGDRVVIGKHCSIGSGVKLHSDVIVGNGCIIMKHAQLKNVTLLPNTYIGSDVRLRDAIVSPIGIFDFGDHYWPIGNEHLISRSRSNQEAATGIPSEHLNLTEKELRT
ncbi:MAG: NDP-sugar synthase [Pseudomonadota bacterium]